MNIPAQHRNRNHSIAPFPVKHSSWSCGAWIRSNAIIVLLAVFAVVAVSQSVQLHSLLKDSASAGETVSTLCMEHSDLVLKYNAVYHS